MKIEDRLQTTDFAATFNQWRSKAEIKAKGDLNYEIHKDSVFISLIDQNNRQSNLTTDYSIIKATYLEGKNCWWLYWRHFQKWHIYDPSPEHESLPALLDAVSNDTSCCFFS